MVINAIFVIFVVIIILIICYIVIKVFDFKMPINSVIQSFISVVLVLSAFELIRLILDITLLQDEATNLIYKDNFFDNIKKTKWFEYISIVNYFMILIGTIVFGIEMYNKEKSKGDYFEIIVLSGVFLICHVIVLL